MLTTPTLNYHDPKSHGPYLCLVRRWDSMSVADPNERFSWEMATWDLSRGSFDLRYSYDYGAMSKVIGWCELPPASEVAERATVTT